MTDAPAIRPSSSQFPILIAHLDHPAPAARTFALPVLALALLLSACGGGGGGTSASTATTTPTSASVASAPALSEAAQLGKAIFEDTTLSSSGRMACASCHDAQHGHASPFDTPVAFGGAALDQAGLRNPPSLRYLRFNGSFRIDADGTPRGGFFWDGRAGTLQEQARGPFLNPHEMGNADAAAVIGKLASAPYAARFRSAFGDAILSQPDVAFDRMTFALQRYQVEDPDFAPFSSKFDAFTAGRAPLTAQELHGLALFNHADKGNCAACHPSTKPANAPGALFTDFSYDNLGVPRNAAIAANADPTFFDGGLCGATRTDLVARTDLCGAFKVPSLRNVALRKRFFHNGAFTSLDQVVRFYVTRDTDAGQWYPLDASGSAMAYDDLPEAQRGNVNTSEGPYNRKPGEAPALNEAEIADVVSFLRTLTDGYVP